MKALHQAIAVFFFSCVAIAACAAHVGIDTLEAIPSKNLPAEETASSSPILDPESKSDASDKNKEDQQVSALDFWFEQLKRVLFFSSNPEKTASIIISAYSTVTILLHSPPPQRSC